MLPFSPKLVQQRSTRPNPWSFNLPLKHKLVLLSALLIASIAADTDASIAASLRLFAVDFITRMLKML